MAIVVAIVVVVIVAVVIVVTTHVLLQLIKSSVDIVKCNLNVINLHGGGLGG